MNYIINVILRLQLDENWDFLHVALPNILLKIFYVEYKGKVTYIHFIEIKFLSMVYYLFPSATIQLD